MLREYEFTLITSSKLSEYDRESLLNKYENMIVADGGALLNKDEWGLQKLAHPIKKQFRGYYVCYQFAALPTSIHEAERHLKIDQNILRYLNIKLSGSHDPKKWHKPEDKVDHDEHATEDASTTSSDKNVSTLKHEPITDADTPSEETTQELSDAETDVSQDDREASIDHKSESLV
ncbi:MAG: 30S ribosomal protein S6 [Proteobacteria bacterium]|nr:30S ribosomal protein S6 [Pseudomonadota bacterium]